MFIVTFSRKTRGDAVVVVFDAESQARAVVEQFAAAKAGQLGAERAMQNSAYPDVGAAAFATGVASAIFQFNSPSGSYVLETAEFLAARVVDTNADRPLRVARLRYEMSVQVEAKTRGLQDAESSMGGAGQTAEIGSPTAQ